MRAADTVRATFESFNLIGDSSRCETDPILFLWKRLRDDFENAVAEAVNNNNSYSTDNEVIDNACVSQNSFASFVLKHTNHAVLTAALELDLADKLSHLNKSNAPEILQRLSANLKRLPVTKSIFVFLFGIEVAQSRVAQEALKALCNDYPDINITKLFGAFEATSDVKQVRGTTNKKNRKPVERFRDAIENLCPTAWPKKKTRTANKKSAKATNSYKAANEALSDDNVDSDNDEDNSDYQLVEDRPSHSGVDDSSDEVDASSPVHSSGSPHNPDLAVSASSARGSPSLSTILKESASLEREPNTPNPIRNVPSPTPYMATHDRSAAGVLQRLGPIDKTNVNVRKRRCSTRLDTRPDHRRPTPLTCHPLDSNDRLTSARPFTLGEAPTPEHARSQFLPQQISLDDSSFERTSDIQSPGDASVVKSMNELPPVPTDCRLSPFSFSDWPRDSLLHGQSLITPQRATIVDGMETQTRTASLIASTAWTSGASLMKCLAMITGSSEPQPGQPGWLLVDSSVTEDSRKLNNQLFRLMAQSSTNIILPLFLSKNHWALGIMRRDRPVSIDVDLYDSLSTKAHDEAARKQLDGFCGRYLPRSTRLPGYIASIPCAQQSNGNDCGVYVIAFAAYVVAQCTVVTIDPSLWRFIVQVMTDLGDPPPPPSERWVIKEHLRQSFQAEFVDHDLLALPRVPVRPPVLTSTTADMLEFEEYMALVFACQSRFHAEMRRAAKSRLPVWTPAHQQLIRTGAVLEKMANMATMSLEAARSYARQKEGEYRWYQTLEVVDRETLRKVALAEEALERAQSCSSKLQVYVETWEFLVDITEEARRTLEERLKIAQS